MPEGPEIRIAANFINEVCKSHIFSGPVIRGNLAVKLPEVEFSADSYTLKAESRGKELKVHLCRLNEGKGKSKSEGITTLLFHFGMTGCFEFTPVDELPKHAHLQFHTSDKKHVLSFVDYRRFGRWVINGDWSKDRGPDPMSQYQEFRTNILDHLEDKTFDGAICEVLLNQKYFNGIGNYLRAEILHRLSIPPFESARSVLEPIKQGEDSRIKKEGPDILDLCHSLPLEVISLGKGKGYTVNVEDDREAFETWLQCYSKPGMKNLVDRNGRTIWFSGIPGKLKPSNGKERARVRGKKSPPKVDNDSKADVKIKKEKLDESEVIKKTRRAASSSKRNKSSDSKTAEVLKKGTIKKEVSEHVSRRKSPNDAFSKPSDGKNEARRRLRQRK